MSNAMRSGKRVLAGVAAGALGMALIPMVGVTSANAAEGTGGVTPVRVTYTSTTQDVVPYAKIYWSGISGQGADDSVIMTLTSAPSGAAQIGMYNAQRSNATAASYTNGATLGGASTIQTTGFIKNGDVDGDATDDSYIWVAANVAGSYAGYVTGNTGTKVNFSFTSTGAPASVDLAVNSASVPISNSNTDMFTLKVKDSGGSYTQIQYVDSAALSTTESGALWFTGATDDSTVSSSELYAGQFPVTLKTAATAGSYTATATPAGTPWGSASSGAYTVIDVASATSISAVDSSTQLNWTNATSGAAGKGIAVPGTTSLTFAITVAEADYGTPVIVNVTGDAFTDGGALEPGAQLVPTDAAGNGSLTVTVPAAGAYQAGKKVVLKAAGINSSGYTSTYTAGTYYCSSTYTSRTPSAGVIAVPTGSAQEVSFSVDDSYGSPVAGLVVAATATGMTTQQSVTDSSGNASVTLPAPALSSTTSVAWTFTVGGKTGSTGACKGLTLQYSASAEVTITGTKINNTTTVNYTGTGSATSPAVIPFKGYIRGYTDTTTTDGKELWLSATVGVASVNVDFTAPSGVWFCATDDTYQLGTTAFADGCSEGAMTMTANGSKVISAYVQATKPGTYTVTGTTSSGNTATWDVTFKNTSDAARNITLAASPSKVSLNSASSLTLSVTDVFGNPVTLDNSGETVALSTDLGTLAGGVNVYTVANTNSAGQAIVSLSSAVAGTATVSAAGSGGQFGDLVDVPFKGAAASVDKAATAVEFTTAPTDMTIAISGERGTVKGKPGVMVDGVTTGISEGEAVIPYIKFPGQTSYSAGSARPKVDAEGEFYWQRKTGKKIYVYFVLESDTDVRSERIIIQAK